MFQDVFKQYQQTFHDYWPKLIPQDKDFAQHCLGVGETIADLPNDDPYIKKYYGSGLVL